MGNEKKGLRHVIERRTQDGTLSVMTMEELLNAIARCIANGQKHIKFEQKNLQGAFQRIEHTLGEASVILVKGPNENAWVLTGWSLSKERLKELSEIPPDERRSALFNSAPTLASSTTSRASEGADGIQGYGTTPTGGVGRVCRAC